MRDRPHRVDFHRVFQDFATLGMTGQALADRTGLRLPLLQRIARGEKVPAPLAQNRIASLWCELTGKPVEFIPRTADADGTLRPEVQGIDLDEATEASYAQLEAITMVWAQIVRNSQ